MLPKSSSSVMILQQSKEMGSKRVRKESKLMRYFKGPLWVLARARDLYTQSLTGHVSYGNTMGCPTPQISSLPRSFSRCSSSSKTSEEELRDLIRLASTRGGAQLRRSKSSMPLGGGGGGGAPPPPVPRSHTVGFGRIDENKAFEFGEDEGAGLLGKVHPKNKSHAVSRSVKVA